MRRLLAILLIAAAAYAGWRAVDARPELLVPIENATERVTETVREAVGDVSAPPPLRKEEDAPNARLTADGVVAETNRHRAEHGHAARRRDAALYAAAEAKHRQM